MVNASRHSDIAVRRLVRCNDLREELLSFAAKHEMRSGVVLSLVGSLSTAVLRLAGGTEETEFQGPVEIVGATGTIAADGLHIHLAIADGKGTTYGGHLLPGCLVETTVEMVILDCSKQWRFDRAHDAATGYKELVATPNRVD